MADLYPTKTRLRLLRAVEAGGVYRSTDNGRCYEGAHEVTARIAEMSRVGWVHLVAMAEGRVQRFRDREQWALTDAGRAILAAHPEATDG